MCARDQNDAIFNETDEDGKNVNNGHLEKKQTINKLYSHSFHIFSSFLAALPFGTRFIQEIIHLWSASPLHIALLFFILAGYFVLLLPKKKDINVTLQTVYRLMTPFKIYISNSRM